MRRLFLLIGLLGAGWTGPARADVAFVQSASASSAGGFGLQTLDVTFPANVAVGNTIVVAIAGNLTPSGTYSLDWCSVTDSLGVTYQPGLGDALTVRVRVLAQAVLTSGANTVTLTCTTGPTSSDLRIAVHEYSGVAAVAMIDQYKLLVDAVGSSATDGMTSDAATTTRDGDLIFGATAVDTATTVTAGTGFTLRETVNVSPTALVTEDLVQVSQGSIAATFTSSAVKPNRTVMMALFDPKWHLKGGALQMKSSKIRLR